MTVYDWLTELGVPWKNKKYYEDAFTHTSYLNEHKAKNRHDNERLEFLGDSVLQIWTADHLFRLKPELPEGTMTTYRAQLVCEKALAGYSRKIGLPEYLKLGIGEEKTGGRDRDSVIADAFEAVLGAIYLDAGYIAASQFLDRMIKPILETPEKTGVINYKSRLQEYVQSDRRDNLVYRVVETEGTSNDPLFTVEAVLEDVVLGVGKGSSKKKVEQEAAKNAISKLAR